MLSEALYLSFTQRVVLVPAGQGGALQAAEYMLLEVGISALKLIQQLFYVLALGVLVSLTAVVYYRQFLPAHEVRHRFFVYIQHRTDDRQVCAAEIGNGAEGAYATLVYKRQHKCLYSIVKMMPKRHLVASKLLRLVVQRTAAHL